VDEKLLHHILGWGPPRRPDDNTSVGEAKRWLKDRLEDGTYCPCCDQFAKIYHRQIHASMAVHLIILYKLSGRTGEYIHKSVLMRQAKMSVSSFGGGDFAMLRFWGLIEEQFKDLNKDSRTSGSWKITEKGILFVDQRITVQQKVRIYNGGVLNFYGPMVSIVDCLHNKFSYADLMIGPVIRLAPTQPVLQ